MCAARKIHLTQETRGHLLKIGGFAIENRGEIFIKVSNYNGQMVILTKSVVKVEKLKVGLNVDSGLAVGNLAVVLL